MMTPERLWHTKTMKELWEEKYRQDRRAMTVLAVVLAVYVSVALVVLG
jgi:hypothetical protein